MKLNRFLTLAAIFCMALHATAQTADDIIQKHLTAIGGADNWKKINTMKITASTNYGGTEVPVIITVQQGKGFRVEYTVNGMTGYNIITNKAGWNYNPFAGQTKAEAMPDDIVKKSQDDLDVQGPLIDYQAKGIKVTYLGKDDVEGTDCFKIKATYPSGKEETMYFDATNYYHIRSVEKIMANDKEMEQTSNYGNFQKLPEGIVFAMSQDGGNGSMTIKSVEINKPVAESLFQPADASGADTRK